MSISSDYSKLQLPGWFSEVRSPATLDYTPLG